MNKKNLNLINKNNIGCSELFYAVNRNDIKNIKILLSYDNIDINIKNMWDETPLHEACYNGNIEIVQMLLEKNADLNLQDKDFNTPLILSSMNGHYGVVKLLISKNADINIKNKRGMSYLDYINRRYDSYLYYI